LWRRGKSGVHLHCRILHSIGFLLIIRLFNVTKKVFRLKISLVSRMMSKNLKEYNVLQWKWAVFTEPDSNDFHYISMIGSNEKRGRQLHWKYIKRHWLDWFEFGWQIRRLPRISSRGCLAYDNYSKQPKDFLNGCRYVCSRNRGPLAPLEFPRWTR